MKPGAAGSESRRELQWQALDPGLIAQLPDELAAAWPLEFFPRRIESTGDRRADRQQDEDGQRLLIAGAAAIFGSVRIRVAMRVHSRVDLVASAGIGAARAVILVRARGAPHVLMRSCPAAGVTRVLSNLLPGDAAAFLCAAAVHTVQVPGGAVRTSRGPSPIVVAGADAKTAADFERQLLVELVRAHLHLTRAGAPGVTPGGARCP